jgi:hypothetical protein
MALSKHTVKTGRRQNRLRNASNGGALALAVLNLQVPLSFIYNTFI